MTPTIAALDVWPLSRTRDTQPAVTARIAGMHAFLQEMHGWYEQMRSFRPPRCAPSSAPAPASPAGSPLHAKQRGAMTSTHAQILDEAIAGPAAAPSAPPSIGLEQYYSEAGPDYAAWSREFNMHFGFFRLGANPLRREAMLEQMNAEVLARFQVDNIARTTMLDLGCGLGGSLRSFALRLPRRACSGSREFHWQVEQASALIAAAGLSDRARVIQGDYEDTILPRAAMTASTPSRAVATHMARTRPRCSPSTSSVPPRRRLVVADGFLRAAASPALGNRASIASSATAGSSRGRAAASVHNPARQLGSPDITVEHLQFESRPLYRTSPGDDEVFVADVLFGTRKMTRARWTIHRAGDLSSGQCAARPYGLLHDHCDKTLTAQSASNSRFHFEITRSPLQPQHAHAACPQRAQKPRPSPAARPTEPPGCAEYAHAQTAPPIWVRHQLYRHERGSLGAPGPDSSDPGCTASNARAITLSARSPTCSTDSPPTIGSVHTLQSGLPYFSRISFVVLPSLSP